MIKFEKIIILFVSVMAICLMLGVPLAMAKGRIEIVPMVTVGETYDDNIFLDKDNKKSDYITTISPGLGLKIHSPKKGLDLFYSPTFVKYHEYSGNDTTRHRASLSMWQEIGASWRFDLKDDYLKSEEASEASFAGYEDRQNIRHTRYTYQRNISDAALTYRFGSSDYFKAGYRHELLENEDPSLDDTRQYGPYSSFVYWFDKKNGLDIDYQFTKTSFRRNDGNPSGDDFDSHQFDIRYIYRVNQKTEGYIGYGYTFRKFEDASRVDRKVHEGSVGLTHGFSELTYLSLDAGYYKPDGYGSEDDSGHVSYGATLRRKLERGNASLRVAGGWDEDYLDSEQRGYTRYWSVAGNVDHEIMKDLTAYAGGSYRANRYLAAREDETYRGNFGLRMSFLRWYSVDLQYSYLNRRSDDSSDEYVDNRIMLMFSASRPFSSSY